MFFSCIIAHSFPRITHCTNFRSIFRDFHIWFNFFLTGAVVIFRFHFWWRHFWINQFDWFCHKQKTVRFKLLLHPLSIFEKDCKSCVRLSINKKVNICSRFVGPEFVCYFWSNQKSGEHPSLFIDLIDIWWRIVISKSRWNSIYKLLEMVAIKTNHTYWFEVSKLLYEHTLQMPESGMHMHDYAICIVL